MPVRRFRSVSEMEGPQPLPPLAPENFAAACALSELAGGLRPRRMRPGVRRFTSAAEAFQAREAWEEKPEGGLGN